MTPAETLRAARALIEKPEAWTQDVSARDANGDPCSAYFANAVCWCVDGALSRVGGGASRLAGSDAYYLVETLPSGVPRSYIRFNDLLNTTHADILALFDRAIARAEATP